MESDSPGIFSMVHFPWSANSLYTLTSFFVMFVSSVFCGHLGKIELDAAMLASSVINIAGVSLGHGMTSACDTLMSQTYGSKNMKRVGIILQRGILIMMLCCFPCWAILLNTEQLLLLCKQNPEVSRLTQKYMMIFLPALPVSFLFLTFYDMSLNLKLLKSWSKDCLQEWDTYMNLAIPCVLMYSIEWWSFEIGGFLAGILGVVELGAQTILMEMLILFYMFPQGFVTAASIRVGNALGAGDVEQAKRSCNVILFIAEAILAKTGDLMAGLTPTRLWELVLLDECPLNACEKLPIAANWGTLMGTGKQKYGTVVNIIGFYIIGLPLGISLMFLTKLKLYGMWIGFISAVSFQTLTCLPYILQIDWDQAFKEARIRAGVEPQAIAETIPDDDSLQMSEINGDITRDPSIQGAIILPDITSGEDDTKQLAMDDGPLKTTNVVGKILSNKQLIIRRGLVLLLCICILLAGIVVKLVVKKT
ncbi:multidrug and toxin extrusion protein 2-like [Gastrophryne carolinensis]